MGRLQGRVAIVTGAARGIGEACVRRLVEDGAKVVATDILPEGEAVAASLGDACVFLAGDASDPAHVAALVALAENTFGLVDALVCSAGIAPNSNFLTLDPEEFARVQRINLHGPMMLGQAVAQRLVAAGKPGAIVNITSTSTRLAGPEQASYCASKAGLDGLTRAMAVGLAPHGIRVNAVGPGPTLTGMAADALAANPDAFAPIIARTPIGRFAQPSEQASVAAFLLSDDASFITGETIYADGGRTALNYTMPPRATS